MLPLCSAPLIALLVAGEDWSSFLLELYLLLGYHNIYLIYLSASIYLVKGGRLGLMPGVLFHSWRPSFRHIGVMFLDFVPLTWWGFMGPSWQFALNKTLPARPNIGFTICVITTKTCIGTCRPPWIFNQPPVQCSSECWSKLGDVRRPLGNLAMIPTCITIMRVRARPHSKFSMEESVVLLLIG